MGFVFRLAASSDEAKLRELFIEMQRSVYDACDAKGYEEGYLDKFFSGREDRIYAAECENEVIAYLSVEVYREEGYIYLDDLSVGKNFRNRGIGTRLMRLAEEYAKSLRIPAIVLHVESSNENAHRLYKRLGFSDNAHQGPRIRMVKDL